MLVEVFKIHNSYKVTYVKQCYVVKLQYHFFDKGML